MDRPPGGQDHRLFGGTDIDGAVLCNAITGESQYYTKEDIPTWVDNVYTPELIMQQYDYHGTLINGFINSVLGQRDVTITTQGSNYIAMNDDVYMYTGVTSANADQSNLGFLLSNQRTKETTFYEAPGATEYAAMDSAMAWSRTWDIRLPSPLLLNISGEPTYFIPLKDQANLVKSYAMVNVARYDIVATADTVTACEQSISACCPTGVSPRRRTCPRPRRPARWRRSARRCWRETPTTSSAWMVRRSSTPYPPRTTPPR